MSEPTRSVPSWFPQLEDTHPIREPRSLQEMSEECFRAQDLQARADAEADKTRRRSQAVKLADMADEAEMAEFMGRPHLSALEYHLLASEAEDRREEAERKTSQARKLRAQEERIAELEAELEQAEADRTRSLRTLTQANEAAMAFRRRSEGAGFPDDRVVGYRRVRDGAVEVRSSEVPRVRSGGPILGIR